MTDPVYKQIELTGSSSRSIEDAVEKAITKAGETVRNMRWFEVTEMRGALDGAKIDQWQVTVKVGFTLDDE